MLPNNNRSLRSLLHVLMLTSMFLGLAGAEYQPRASARHILVDTEELCLEIQDKLNNGADFADMAKKYSTCGSSERGGDLGNFKFGKMVKPFNDVVFNEEVGPVHGPVKTTFGYHLIQIMHRSNSPESIETAEAQTFYRLGLFILVGFSLCILPFFCVDTDKTD